MSASDKLDEFRAEMGGFYPSKLRTDLCIRGAQCDRTLFFFHRRPNVELHEGTFLMTDTGAGFYEGSTDITRTYAFGEVFTDMKVIFTLVATVT